MQAGPRYAIRFVPPQDARSLPLDVYTDSMRHMQAALASLVQTAANDYADSKSWPRFTTRLYVESFETGSVVAPLAIEYIGEPALVCPANQGRELFVRAAKRVRLAARGSVTDLPSATAESLVSAARRAADAKASVQIAERPQRGWRSLISISRVATELDQYVKNRRLVRHATVQLVGRIEAVRFDGPSFDLLLPAGSLRVRAKAEDRERLRVLWGSDVTVTADVQLTAEGEIKAGGLATSVEPVKTFKNPLAEYLASRGAGHGAWDSDEAREYLKNLRS